MFWLYFAWFVHLYFINSVLGRINDIYIYLGANCMHIVQQQFAINSETGKDHVRNVSPASNFPLSDGTKNKRTVNKI